MGSGVRMHMGAGVGLRGDLGVAGVLAGAAWGWANVEAWGGGCGVLMTGVLGK